MCLLQHDLAPLQQRVKQLSQEGQHLSTSYPESATHIVKRESQAVTAWLELNAKSQRRKQKLGQAEELQHYLNDFRDLRFADATLLDKTELLMFPTSWMMLLCTNAV